MQWIRCGLKRPWPTFNIHPQITWSDWVTQRNLCQHNVSKSWYRRNHIIFHEEDYSNSETQGSRSFKDAILLLTAAHARLLSLNYRPNSDTLSTQTTLHGLASWMWWLHVRIYGIKSLNAVISMKTLDSSEILVTIHKLTCDNRKQFLIFIVRTSNLVFNLRLRSCVSFRF